MVKKKSLIGILSLQGDITEHLHSVTSVGALARPVRRVHDLVGVDGLIIPGGESSVISGLLDTFGLEAPIRKELDAGLPVWGTCAGMIMLGRQILDGAVGQKCFGAIDVSVRRNAFGSQQHSFEEEIHIKGIEGSYTAIFIRAPIVEDIGKNVKVLAESKNILVNGHPACVAVANEQVLGTAFHPELTNNRALVNLFLREFVGK